MSEQPEGTVVYVDDDELNRNLFALVFREAGFDVKEAATGSEALRLAAEKPDLVILDVNLPDIDGFEVCRHIKAHPATRSIPVMHMSAVHVTSEDRTHALEDGADVYLTKPVEPKELVAQARALLRIHQAEERARAAARQWQATFAAINDAVCLLDRQGRVLRCNDAAERLLQRPSSEILGRNWEDLTPTPGAGEPSVFGRMLQTHRRATAELAVGQRWFQASADPLLADDGTVIGAVCILSDVTQRKHLEEQLRQSQKMEAVGQLAGGVAHDFNNLLTAITGNISLLLAGKTEQDPDRAPLLVIEQAAWRAAELTRQLLNFARRSVPHLKPTDLRACLEEVATLLGRTLDPRITLEIRTAPDLWPVLVDPGQIHQVLMNLCLNARDAMPAGGRLLLVAENAVLVEGRPGQFVCLRVRDSGHGIEPDALPHIFEPFFTTKGLGKGTGLGLATVHGIVQAHQGWVECSSAVDQGTCFDVYLPRSPAQEPRRIEEECPLPAGPGQ
jgi:PAS domain S-box-containing protein